MGSTPTNPTKGDNMSIKESLAESNPEAILYDGCDEALVGIGYRCSGEYIAVYSYKKLIEVFIKEFGDYESAVEWVEYNIVGGWLGKQTPIILYT